ncbi:hypothetical protein [Roseibium sp. RKSG952]|uniref:hypothetical protein n=1 Tax=Roseibium sp. RKSG952 TaxID=2529384 RepID=UPI0012BCF5C1|nr:hypothetical protein [Roseibium sp. RKSG952]MTH95118.1 hypothetical protein [Roseibium sp. RKSG952]
MSDANQEMMNQAGIIYLSVMESLHGDRQALQRAFDKGVTPGSFVSEVISDFGLVLIKGDRDPADVANYNRTKAAIIEFSGSVDDWTLGKAGTVYSQNDDGIAIMSPKKNPNTGNFYFQIDQHSGATLSPTGDIQGDVSPSVRSRGIDIESAIEFHNERTAALASGRPSNK